MQVQNKLRVQVTLESSKNSREHSPSSLPTPLLLLSSLTAVKDYLPLLSAKCPATLFQAHSRSCFGTKTFLLFLQVSEFMMNKIRKKNPNQKPLTK